MSTQRACEIHFSFHARVLPSRQTHTMHPHVTSRTFRSLVYHDPQTYRTLVPHWFVMLEFLLPGEAHY